MQSFVCQVLRLTILVGVCQVLKAQSACEDQSDCSAEYCCAQIKRNESYCYPMRGLERPCLEKHHGKLRNGKYFAVCPCYKELKCLAPKCIYRSARNPLIAQVINPAPATCQLPGYEERAIEDCSVFYQRLQFALSLYNPMLIPGYSPVIQH